MRKGGLVACSREVQTPGKYVPYRHDLTRIRQKAQQGLHLPQQNLLLANKVESDGPMNKIIQVVDNAIPPGFRTDHLM